MQDPSQVYVTYTTAYGNAGLNLHPHGRSSDLLTVEPRWKLLFFFFFKWLHPWHLKVPGLGIESELQLQPRPQLWQQQIL